MDLKAVARDLEDERTSHSVHRKESIDVSRNELPKPEQPREIAEGRYQNVEPQAAEDFGAIPFAPADGTLSKPDETSLRPVKMKRKSPKVERQVAAPANQPEVNMSVNTSDLDTEIALLEAESVKLKMLMVVELRRENTRLEAMLRRYGTA